MVCAGVREDPAATVSTLASITASCTLAAGTAFNLPPPLLIAIIHVESAGNPRAIGRNANSTYDIGLMQISSSWLPLLKKAGVSEKSLYDPCVNIHVGAWILSQEVERYGYSWEAIGAYNAGPYNANSKHWKLPIYQKYAKKVLTTWRRLTLMANRQLVASTTGRGGGNK